MSPYMIVLTLLKEKLEKSFGLNIIISDDTGLTYDIGLIKGKDNAETKNKINDFILNSIIVEDIVPISLLLKSLDISFEDNKNTGSDLKKIVNIILSGKKNSLVEKFCNTQNIEKLILANENS